MRVFEVGGEGRATPKRYPVPGTRGHCDQAGIEIVDARCALLSGGWACAYKQEACCDYENCTTGSGG